MDKDSRNAIIAALGAGALAVVVGLVYSWLTRKAIDKLAAPVSPGW